MKKNNVKAFTLVEMLIVIVIIGILIASLMPRMQSAQGRARDVARKNDLAQIQTAIITSQQDRGAYPGMDDNEAKSSSTATWSTWATEWLKIEEIAYNLQKAGMTQTPSDPNGSNSNSWLGKYTGDTVADWQYLYLVATRNWVKNGWFVLMAKTEVEWWSNWLYCGSWTAQNGKKSWAITGWTDLKDVTTCTSFIEATENTNECWIATDWKCTYSQTDQLRYVLVY